MDAAVCGLFAHLALPEVGALMEPIGKSLDCQTPGLLGCFQDTCDCLGIGVQQSGCRQAL